MLEDVTMCEEEEQNGFKSKNVIGFMQALLFDINQSGWPTMTTDNAGILFWLEDLDMSNKEQK